MLKTPKELKVDESVLADIMKVDDVNNYLKKKRLITCTHMSRLKYNNPARVIVITYGDIHFKEKKDRRKKKTINWYDQTNHDLSKIIKNENIINIMNKQFRRNIKDYKMR